MGESPNVAEKDIRVEHGDSPPQSTVVVIDDDPAIRETLGSLARSVGLQAKLPWKQHFALICSADGQLLAEKLMEADIAH